MFCLFFLVSTVQNGNLRELIRNSRTQVTDTYGTVGAKLTYIQKYPFTVSQFNYIYSLDS